MTLPDSPDRFPPAPPPDAGAATLDPFDSSPQVLSRRGRAAVLARIHALMEYWGITVDDLNAPDDAPPASSHEQALPVKYRHPVTGDTWDGQGAHPDWLRKALLQEGLRVDELRPEPANPSTE
jgi:DNA-binding protein H-NS